MSNKSSIQDSFKVPIALFIYKRNQNFSKIINPIREIHARKIYIVADGAEIADDKECLVAREKIESLIDWPCEVIKYYSETNLGFKKRFTTGLNQILKQEEAAIIIEDDCIPNIDFFKFCEEMLRKYRNTSNIMSISGNNFLFNKLDIHDSYYFSRYPLTWGWATWKRAWLDYEPDISDWDSHKNAWLKQYLGSSILTFYWSMIFDLVKAQKIKAWDYQFTYLSFKKRGLHIIPRENLVSNVGVDSYATHTKSRSKSLGIEAKKMQYPLVHPNKVAANTTADSITERNIYLTPIVLISIFIKSIIKYTLCKKN